MDSIEKLLVSIGLYTPARRFLGFAGITALVVYGLKPSAMFEDGVARPWSILGGDEDTLPGTSIPWWLLPIIVGIIGAMFL